jgi:DNA topoisomerase-1
MKKNLLIVESPAKAKTIEKYLGKDFTVLSSVGHIRNIAKKTTNGTPPIDIKNGYKTTYEIDSDKTKVITGLKKAAKAADTVWLATDPDREGEAIAWHLCEVLKLNPEKTNRITYQEISKNAVEEAVKNPRGVDMDLVAAQQARQILDRIVGFELSPVVWKKVPGGKSAGRVQSPAVRLLVEREREIEKFATETSFKITAQFSHGKDVVFAELSERFDSEAEANDFLNSLVDSRFTVADVTTSPATRSPQAPFTTSTLQQEANSRLGFGARATMASAQKLYQDGKITYMRTDSVNISKQALASTAGYIKKTYGEKYSQVRNFKTKSANAQEAHEAIRPTDISIEKAGKDGYDQKLYDLIRRRTLASQMAPAQLEKTVITIRIGKSDDVFASSTAQKNELVFEAKGEVVIFDGFLKVYGAGKKDATILPPIRSGDILGMKLSEAKQMFSRPPARYTEGSLVKKLEELGIGRPSTYATIINTIQARGYANKGENEGAPRDAIVLRLKNKAIEREIIQEKTGSDRGKLIPSPSGEVLSDFLKNHFKQIVDYDFTANVETEFDKIATGALARNVMLDHFYQPFHELIENSGDIDRASVAKAREVGIDPKTKKPIFARLGKYGPMLQLGESNDGSDKPQFAPMPEGRKIENVTLKDAILAFKLPRLVGQTEDGQDVKANIGRFGPYIQVDKLFVSIKPLDPHTISIEEALRLYADKLKAEAEKNVADFGDGIKVLRGRFGPYVTNGLKNAKIPKDTDPKSITHEQAKKILDSAPTNKKARAIRGRRKKT